MAKRRIAKLIAGEVDKLGVGKSLGDEYAVKLEAAAAKKPRKKRAKKSQPNSDLKPPKQPQADVNIDDYVKRLNDADTDENKFFEVFNEIKSKGLSNKQLNELGSKYANFDDPKIFSSLYKKAEDKLRQIEMRMRQKESTQVYGRIIRKTNPWQ